MRIIKIDPFDNGAHANQIGHLDVVPDGWAVIPDAMLCENFPFGDVEVEEIDGVVTVTKWTPGTIPEPEPLPTPGPTAQDDTDSMLADHEYRIAMLELGLTE